MKSFLFNHNAQYLQASLITLQIHIFKGVLITIPCIKRQLQSLNHTVLVKCLAPTVNV